MNLRILLILFHIFITIFLIYNLHPKAYLVSQNAKLLSSAIIYINEIFRIGLYHSSSIIALWHSHYYTSNMIYATEILLIGEFSQVFTYSIEHFIEYHRFLLGEIIVTIIALWLFLPAIYYTYRFAKEVNDSMKKELLRIQTITSDLSVDEQGIFNDV